MYLQSHARKKNGKTYMYHSIVESYRDKNRVEEAFKEVKSFLKFQPTFVYTDEHVRVYYTICILSYLLNVRGCPTIQNRVMKKAK